MRIDLARQLSDAYGLQLLAMVRGSDGLLAGVMDWEKVVAIVNDQSVAVSTRDSILNALLGCYRNRNCCYAVTALTLCFWKRLRYLSRRVQRSSAADDDSMQSVLAAFYETISSSNFRNVRDLSGRIYSRTSAKISSLFKKERQKNERFAALFDPDRVVSQDGSERESLELADTVDTSRVQVRMLVAQGVFGPYEQALIERTRLDGNSVKSVAAELGITADAARSARTRAERLLKNRGYQLAIYRDLGA